jgi:NAD-dependent SIR2 family protein deacetylase
VPRCQSRSGSGVPSANSDGTARDARRLRQGELRVRVSGYARWTVHAYVATAWRHLAGRRVVVLTGAGLSTDSGIPDYRGPDSPPRKPITYREFLSGDDARRRYWARSYVGWRHLRDAAPNGGHRALADLEHRGVVSAVITQNVDGLHGDAGSRTVVELHGRIRDVVCLSCGALCRRDELQRQLTELNPDYAAHTDVEIAPDGDAVIAALEPFAVAPCRCCGGVLKPDVVFFGENVPRDRVERCYAYVDEADALLVAGSSLAVLSGLRFVRRAHERRIPVVIVNRGETRGDGLSTVKVHGGCSETLTAFAAAATSPERFAPTVSPR